MHSNTLKQPIITLTSDFGLKDEYVGMLKGVLLSHCLSPQIIDVTHSIQPQDILSAAIVIGRSYHYFPEGTVHMVVIDPGVGSQRSILALKADNHFFIAPNNGVLSPLLTKDRISAIFSVENSELFLPNVSNTFHGRDIIAPVAAKIASGLQLAEVGPALTLDHCLCISLPKAKLSAGTITGKIIAIDNFGNLQTSITKTNLANYSSRSNLIISLNTYTIKGVNHFYGEREPGEIMALLDSRNHLEIAISGGNAASILNSKVGDTVIISYQ